MHTKTTPTTNQKQRLRPTTQRLRPPKKAPATNKQRPAIKQTSYCCQTKKRQRHINHTTTPAANQKHRLLLHTNTRTCCQHTNTRTHFYFRVRLPVYIRRCVVVHTQCDRRKLHCTRCARVLQKHNRMHPDDNTGSAHTVRLNQLYTQR